MSVRIALAALGATTALWLCPSEAKCQPAFGAVDHGGKVTGGAGIYVSFTFGKELGVGYGAEGHFEVFGRPFCTGNQAPAGAGGLFQIGGINGSTLRMVGAAHGGGGFARDTGVMMGELGLADHIGRNRGFGLHTGLDYDAYFVNLFFRQEWFLSEYSVGLGHRFFPTLSRFCNVSV